MKIFLTVLFFAAELYARTFVALNNQAIAYDGVLFPQISTERAILDRYNESMLANPESGISQGSIPYAYTQSGIRIRFKTSSPTVLMTFTERTPGGKLGLHNGFGVYADGARIAVYETLSFLISSPNKKKPVLYEVVLPSIHAVDFTGLSLDDGCSLEKLPPLNKPVYAAIGNSITHGTGQQSASFLTYPFILAGSMGWDLYNLAVAGAYTGWPVAQLLKHKKVDFITIEFGFNDWMWDNKPISEKNRVYCKLLDTLRYYHNFTKIFCITPLTTTQTAPSLGSSFSIEDYRKMVRAIVKDRRIKGDINMFVIQGESITDSTMLWDGIHLSESGAARFAASLKEKMISILKMPSASVPAKR